MSEIKLFSIKNDVKQLIPSEVLLEKELQNLIEDNMEKFFGVWFLKSEYVITNGRMDSIGIDENNCPVIVEYKRSSNENIINQGLFYLDWLLDHKDAFHMLVAEKYGYKYLRLQGCSEGVWRCHWSGKESRYGQGRSQSVRLIYYF